MGNYLNWKHSKWGEEEKSTEIPQVVASEHGMKPNHKKYTKGCGQSFNKGQKASRNGMGRPADTA